MVGALTNAVTQFKSHRSPRMKQYLRNYFLLINSNTGNISIKSSFNCNCSCANGGRVQQIRQLHRCTHVRNRPIQSLSACCLLLNCSCFFRLLEPLLWDYRKDLWWVPLTSLLQLGLRCAFLSARTAEYFTYAVELC